MFGAFSRVCGSYLKVSTLVALLARMRLGERWGKPYALLLSGLLVAELVADAPNGQDHLRVFRVVFDLRSQAIDV